MGSCCDPSSGSPSAAAFSSFLDFPTLWTLIAPRDVSDEGLDRLGLEAAGDPELLPRRVLRDRPEEGVTESDSSSESGSVRVSSRLDADLDGDDSPLLFRLDLERSDEEREPIGVSGTGASAAAIGG